jgi:hypothetical protein
MKGKPFLALSLLCVTLWGCGSPSRVQAPQTPPTPPTPQFSSFTISPTSAVVGSPDLTLTIKGSNFGGGHTLSQAVWSANGTKTPLATTFVSSTQLTAVVPGDLLNAPVAAQIFVQTSDLIEGGPPRLSGSAGFIVTTSPAAPVMISSISPSSAPTGSSDIIVTVTGSNFDAQRFHMSIVGWSAVPGAPHCCVTWLNTRSFSNTELTAVIPAALLQSPGTAEVFVETGDPQGISDGVSYPRSNSLTFKVGP